MLSYSLGDGNVLGDERLIGGLVYEMVFGGEDWYFSVVYSMWDIFSSSREAF